MQITIELSIEDLRIAKSVAQNQTHFVINSECIEDAVITGILQQIDTLIPNQRLDAYIKVLREKCKVQDDELKKAEIRNSKDHIIMRNIDVVKGPEHYIGRDE